MKIKDNFILRQIAGTWLVVPVGERVSDFDGMITLSDSGALLWELLGSEKTYDELVVAVLHNYEVDEETVRKDVSEFLDELKQNGLIE